MTSNRTDDGFKFECEACGETFRPPRLGRGSDRRSWEECFALAKEAGWRAVPVKSKKLDVTVFEHRCPGCV